MFILALLAFFAIALPDAMLGVAWPFMRVTFDQPLAAMTLVLPLGVAATVLSTSSWTWAAARLGLGRLLAGSLAMSTAALFISATAPAYWVVVACAVLFGLSAGAIDAALNAYAVQHLGPRRINFLHAAYGVGAATSPLIVSAVVSARRMCPTQRSACRASRPAKVRGSSRPTRWQRQCACRSQAGWRGALAPCGPSPSG